MDINKQKPNLIQLTDKYDRLIYAVISRYLDKSELVAEAVQEVLIAMYNASEKILTLKGNDQKKYICALCRNISIDIFNSEKRQQGISLDDEDNSLELIDDFNIDEKLSHIKIGSNVDEYIQKLSLEEQTILILFYVYGESHDEIAKKLKINTSASRKKLSRIKRKLSEMMSEDVKKNHV